ncbi:hypothetical protein [Rhizobium sp. L1K21]|uniref:hypothetical protein n=1 Tax=Rhizobium sp. L1K21 TaxID=2954933 RepID=UPI002092E795|nr:hypothetical protein [Rhizobium sp. L1K21]MCO6185533.1 hypothetical protein [Rhizobium sp. L1K21]
MIFATSFLLGISTAALRSAAAVIFVAIFIAVAFVAAAIASQGHVSFLELFFSVLGYNAGIIGLLAGGLVIKAKAS